MQVLLAECECSQATLQESSTAGAIQCIPEPQDASDNRSNQLKCTCNSVEPQTAYTAEVGHKDISMRMCQEVVLWHIVPESWALSLTQQQHFQVFSDALKI